MDEEIPIQKADRHPFAWGCVAVALLGLVLIAALATAVWWSQRPIRPVVLNEEEKIVVEAKVRELEGPGVDVEGGGTGAQLSGPDVLQAEPDRTYVPGAKTLRLTEREINGLLNMNTELGQQVRLEFAQDAINAYLAIPVPEDFPIGGGTIIKMRGRFKVSIGGEGKPYAVLEDITIFGLSLPKAWLGGIKGENLLEETLADAPVQGIKSLRVEPGVVVIEVDE